MPYTGHKESRVIRPALTLSSGPGGDSGRLPAVRRLAFLGIGQAAVALLKKGFKVGNGSLKVCDSRIKRGLHVLYGKVQLENSGVSVFKGSFVRGGRIQGFPDKYARSEARGRFIGKRRSRLTF